MISEFDKRLADLEDLLEDSWNLPLANNKFIINGDKLRGIIESLRQQLPSELKKANEIIETRDKTLARAREEADIMTERAKKNAEILLTKAKKSADEIVQKAQAEAEILVDETEIMAIATEKAQAIVDQAKQDAIKMRNVAVQYVDGILSDTEKSLGAALSAIDQVKKSVVKE